jgi:hypothetical protein
MFLCSGLTFGCNTQFDKALRFSVGSQGLLSEILGMLHIGPLNEADLKSFSDLIPVVASVCQRHLAPRENPALSGGVSCFLGGSYPLGRRVENPSNGHPRVI